MRALGVIAGGGLIVVAVWTVAQGGLPRALSAVLPAQESACGDSATLSWEPTTPREGALFRVRVAGARTGTVLAGAVAGEALHFGGPLGADAAESFAPVPMDSSRSVRVVVRCTMGTTTDTLVAVIATARGEYPMERLSVAPAFTRPPDSALAARIRRETQTALDVAQRSHTTPRLWRDSFLLPRESRITSGFGDGREFNGVVTSRHMGTDFAGASGSPVRAINRGVVRVVDGFFYGGSVVYIDHGAGLTSAYLHLSKQVVAAGDTVDRGQSVGLVGATGRVTGPHLHLIVRYGGTTVDPLSLFAIAGDSASRQARGH